jgi:hypothetical protein
MSLYHDIVAVYPELTDDDFSTKGKISLRDDGDGIEYINKWEYSEPIPNGLSLGKPKTKTKLG